MLAAACAGLLAWALAEMRSLPLPESALHQLPCVSYAPFRRAGHTPFDPALRITPQQIEADLRLLATVTPCVRTYGMDHGLDAVPALAERLGLRVVLGVWIGRDAAANADQLERALALARRHADTIDLLVVGNEVLLRGDLPAAELAELLARARRAAPVPVTYADVWEFWLRHAEILLPHTDVVAAHILPYWEDEPVGIDVAVDHVYTIAARLHARFGATPVFIAETGWPAAGRQRGPARPGVREQARFVRELLARQATAPLHFNLIEGFDQPWKRVLEGRVGGAWGLFDAEGAQRVPLAGPLVPPSAWQAVVSRIADLAWQGRSAGERAQGLALLGFSALCLAFAATRLVRRLAGRDGGPSRGVAGFDLARLGLLVCALVDVLGLAFDGRYRSLHWPLFAAPAVLLLLLAWLGERRPPGALRWGELSLAIAALPAAGAVLVVEGTANAQALCYALALGGLAVGAGALHRASVAKA